MTYNCEINLNSALDWQRSNADKLKSYIDLKQQWYEKNHCEFWNNWVTDVFNLDTANEFGLSVWSVILDEPLFGVTEKSPPGFHAWGFGQYMRNFERGVFGANADTGYNFTIEQKRILLKLKAYILHMSGSTRDTNEALKNIFGENQVLCFDGLNMTLTYVIANPAIKNFVREVENRDLLPRPAAVGISVVSNSNVRRFGFNPNMKNFGNGNFTFAGGEI